VDAYKCKSFKRGRLKGRSLNPLYSPPVQASTLELNCLSASTLNLMFYYFNRGRL